MYDRIAQPTVCTAGTNSCPLLQGQGLGVALLHNTQNGQNRLFTANLSSGEKEFGEWLETSEGLRVVTFYFIFMYES